MAAQVPARITCRFLGFRTGVAPGQVVERAADAHGSRDRTGRAFRDFFDANIEFATTLGPITRPRSDAPPTTCCPSGWALRSTASRSTRDERPRSRPLHRRRGRDHRRPSPTGSPHSSTTPINGTLAADPALVRAPWRRCCAGSPRSTTSSAVPWRHRGRRPADRAGRPAPAALPVGQPRRGGVRGSVPLRHPPLPQPPPLVRVRHPPLHRGRLRPPTLAAVFGGLARRATDLRVVTEPDVEPNIFARAVRRFDLALTPGCPK